MNRKIFLLFVFFFVLTQVGALGLTPARTTFEFTPGLEKSTSFTLVNSEKKDLNVVIAVQGDLKDYVKISEANFFMSSEEETKTINYKVAMPSELKPGPHTAEIVVLQLPNQGSLAVTYVGAALALATEIVVNVPYPGKYVETNFNVYPSSSDEGGLDFKVVALNRGTFDIVSLKSDVEVYCDERRVATLRGEEVSLDSQERKDFSLNWKPNVNAGECYADLTLLADDEQLPFTAKKNFEVGGDVLTLVTMEVNDFSLGEIAKFEATIRNNVQQTVEGAHLVMEIYDNGGNALARVESPTQNIEPQQKMEMQLYWDTKGVSKGNYDATLFLNSENGNDEIDFEMVVSESDISFNGIGFVIAKPTKKSSDGVSTLMIVLIFLIAFLILINLSWFLFLRKRLK